MKVVTISGKAQHGKDTTANIIQKYLERDGYRVSVVHYGDLVKHVCKAFFGWDGRKDTEGRALLQKVGTDVVRQKDPDYWVKFVKSIADMFENSWDYMLIPDCRFPNEISIWKDYEGGHKHVRVFRGGNFKSPLTPEQQLHVSETSLDYYPVDYSIMNVGSIADLDQHIYSELSSIVG